MSIAAQLYTAGKALIHVKGMMTAAAYIGDMSTRAIIAIDEGKCTGCGLCIPNCPEGALQVIDGKVRLVSDLFCDGLGACIGYCPEGAISITQREAEPYDERRVMEGMLLKGPNVTAAHLEHLRAHGEERLISEARAFLMEKGIPVPEIAPAGDGAAALPEAGRPPHAGSRLSNWPIQLHLLSPMSPRFRGADILLSADCVAHSVGSFHERLLAGKALAIACPKLDEGKDIYQEKLVALIDHAQIRSLTVAMMEVPCCGGLLRLARTACAQAHRKVPLKALVVAISDGAILSEEWVRG